MKIRFVLLWARSKNTGRDFKMPASGELFGEYIQRIRNFSDIEVVNQSSLPAAGRRLWLCDRARGKAAVSSEALSEKLNQSFLSGTKTLEIVIGGPDGTAEEWIQTFRPDFIWSFGALTLPHELAAVVAAEQMYRAFSILNHLPYHKGH